MLFWTVTEGGGRGGWLEGKRQKVAQNEKYKFYGGAGEGGGGWQGVKEQKMTHNYQFQSVTLCHTNIVSGILDHIIKIYGIQV